MDISIKPKIFVSTDTQSTRISQGFALSKINHIPCAYCRKEMTTPKYLKKIFNDDSPISTDCIEAARENGHLLSPEKQQILNMLTQTQAMHGLTTDNQIIKSAIRDSIDFVRDDILQRYNDIVNLVKKSPFKRAKEYLMFNENRNRLYIVKKADYENLVIFVRGKTFLNISPKDAEAKEINAIIEDFESGIDKYPEAYMMRRGIYKFPSEFYIDLFEKTLSSVDHVIPKSKGGFDTRNNFLAVCRGCNEKKGSTSLPVFMASNSEIKPNIEYQIKFLREAVPKLISDRKLTHEYDSYPDEISENLQKITNNQLDLMG